MFKKLLLLLVMVLLMLLLLVVYPALHKAAGLPGRLPNAGPGIHCERSVASSRACVTLLSDYESELPRLLYPSKPSEFVLAPSSLEQIFPPELHTSGGRMPPAPAHVRLCHAHTDSCQALLSNLSYDLLVC